MKKMPLLNHSALKKRYFINCKNPVVHNRIMCENDMRKCNFSEQKDVCENLTTSKEFLRICNHIWPEIQDKQSF